MTGWLKRGLIVGLLALLLAIASVATFAPSPLLAQSQPSVEELRQRQRQLDQKRNQLNQQQNQLENLQESAEDRLDGLQENITVTAAQIKQNEAKLKQAGDRLKALEAELARAEKAFQMQQFATVARLKFLQRQKQGEGWAVLLQSQNLNEFLDRRYQLRKVYAADRHFLDELATKSAAITAQQRKVESQKNEIALITEELLAQKSEYEAQANAQSSLIDRLKKDRQALEEAESRLEQDSANIANLIRRRINGARNRAILPGTGIMGIPASGRLTSNFGYRRHPILGYRRFHAGIDFGAASGSPIWAADNGVVIFAGWYGGYGRTVIIDHGNNITTLYGHTSRIYVHEGQTVRRGDTIAAVGSTGLSTGPHLHFEVRRNGEPVNPLNYL